jgi:hypothetical protein
LPTFHHVYGGHVGMLLGLLGSPSPQRQRRPLLVILLIVLN